MNYQRNPMKNPFSGGAAPMPRMEDGSQPGASELDCLRGKSLAMVYSPYQEFNDIYDEKEGLAKGTIFMALDKPFLGTKRGI